MNGKKQIVYVKVYAQVLLIDNLSLTQKILLCLVLNSKNGMKLGNELLGNLLKIDPTSVSRLLSNMESKQYIKIQKRRSKYRTIYFDNNNKVGQNLLWHLRQSTLTFTSIQNDSTLAKMPDDYDINAKHNYLNNRKNNNAQQKDARSYFEVQV